MYFLFIFFHFKHWNFFENEDNDIFEGFSSFSTSADVHPPVVRLMTDGVLNAPRGNSEPLLTPSSSASVAPHSSQCSESVCVTDGQMRQIVVFNFEYFVDIWSDSPSVHVAELCMALVTERDNIPEESMKNVTGMEAEAKHTLCVSH